MPRRNVKPTAKLQASMAQEKEKLKTEGIYVYIFSNISI